MTIFLFFKQKTAYEMRISDWSSDVCSSDLGTSITHTLTAGNSCDVDPSDFIAYLAEDPRCKAIACVFEGLSDIDRFLEAADRAWRADKPQIGRASCRERVWQDG